MATLERCKGTLTLAFKVESTEEAIALSGQIALVTGARGYVGNVNKEGTPEATFTCGSAIYNGEVGRKCLAEGLLELGMETHHPPGCLFVRPVSENQPPVSLGA